MANYEVLELSFINGQLCRPGEVVELEIDSPGSNLKLVGESKPKRQRATKADEPEAHVADNLPDA